MSSRQADRRPLPSKERLNELFSYDPENGLLLWKIRTGSRTPVGQVAGWKNSVSKRRWVSIDGVQYIHARVVYCFHKGDPAGWLIDHINRDPTDDRIDNLRLVRARENSINAGMHANNTSGCKGVSWDAKRQKWYAYITDNGRMLSLGRHTTLAAAISARKAAEARLFAGYTPEFTTPAA